MTYKYTATGVNLSGGKAVVIGDPKRSYGEALSDLRPIYQSTRQLAELGVMAWGTDIDEEKLERVWGDVAIRGGQGHLYIRLLAVNGRFLAKKKSFPQRVCGVN